MDTREEFGITLAGLVEENTADLELDRVEAAAADSVLEMEAEI
jgi:hypothetical protein